MKTLISAIFVIGLIVAPTRAQESAAAELIRRVPDDLGLCLVVHDLRGQLERWQKTDWFKLMEKNPLVAALLEKKEIQDLREFENILRQFLKFDYAMLRDDFVGDGVVLAYQPGQPDQGISEKGLVLLKPRKADSFEDVINAVNDAQMQSGEVKSLDERKHNGQLYTRRALDRTSQYYFRKDNVFVFSNDEDLLKDVIARPIDGPAPRRDLWLKAGMNNAAVSAFLNPRTFDKELAKQVKAKSGTESAAFQKVIDIWKGLDGIFVSLHGDDTLELRLTILARPGTLPGKLWANPGPPPVELWHRFPTDALISAALPVDFAGVFKQVQQLMPEKDVRGINDLVQNKVGAATGLNVLGDVLPNLGPDIGFCVSLPEGTAIPQAIVALAVKPLPKERPADQAIAKAIAMGVGAGILAHNLNNPHPFKLEKITQGMIELTVVKNEKLLPPGVHPTYALKDGFLLVASSPEAIADFRVRETPPANGETPLVRIAPRQWSRLIKTHRQEAINHLVLKNNEPLQAATTLVDGLSEGLNAFQSLTLSQRNAGGLAVWTLRLTPAKN